MPWLFSPRQWFGDLARRPLLVERRGLNLHFALGAPAPKHAEPAREPRSGQALRRAHRELRELLGRHPDAPKMLPHLAFIEQGLRRDGSDAIPRLPLSVLHRGLAQLNSVTRDGQGEGLAELRRRLGRAIEHRTREPARAAAPKAADHEMDISEASHSLFEEMERSWTGQVPQST